MKILMITPYVPFPLHSGGQIRTWNLVKRLCTDHQFTLVCFYREEKEKKFKDELKKIFTEAYFIKKDKPWTIGSLLKSFGKYPLLMNLYDQSQAKIIISDLLQKEKWDLIHCEPFYVMQNLPERISAPVVLVEHNVEYLAYARYVQNQKIAPLKLSMKRDVSKIKKWEEYFWHKAAKVVAVSYDDQQIMQKAGISSVSLVPNGVDLDYFNFNPKPDTDEKIILFVGDFKWFPNIEAADVLKNKIWTKIKEKDSKGKIKLWIVGKYIPDNVKSWASDYIKISERLPDIRDAYKNSDVLLAPIYSGSGTKYKILEAMASGCAVVTTPLGAEGLKVVNGNNVLIAETPEDLAVKTLEILSDEGKKKSLVANARQTVEENYSWDRISGELEKVYQSL